MIPACETRGPGDRGRSVSSGEATTHGEGQLQDRVRVLLVEDEPLFRDLLRAALARHPRLEVVGADADGAAALAAAPALRPRVALLDIELGGGMHGVRAGLLLRRLLPGLGVVLLSNHADPGVLASLPPGAAAGWSYLLKRSVGDAAALARAVEGAAAGRVVVDPLLAAGRRPRADSPLARLSPRQRDILALVAQRDILALVAQGHTNAAAARRLGLAEKSVENQLGLVYQRLGVDRDDAGLHPRVSAVLRFLEQSRAAPRHGQALAPDGAPVPRPGG